ncbi:MAG: patatin-like phospholipase family protein [Candidatus Obscuribacter sp.]|nr:patatin-like phospholipase family protein [Candidatus Obscuribacter sp.]
MRRLIIAFLLIALGQVSPACAQEQQKTGIKIEAQAQSVPVKPKLAIAIGGGGLRSASAIGVLKALEDEGITIDIITGTSMGAVVGGLYAAGVTPIHIEEEFTQKKLMHAFLTIPLKLRVMVIPLFYTPRLIGIEPYDGLYRGKRFATYLNKQVPVTEHNIEDLKIPFGAVAVSLLDGKAKTIKSGNLGKALQASCAIPALRKPVKLGGDLFVDGGALVNLPVMQARELGGDIVVAINVDEKSKTPMSRLITK